MLPRRLRTKSLLRNLQGSLLAQAMVQLAQKCCLKLPTDQKLNFEPRPGRNRTLYLKMNTFVYLGKTPPSRLSNKSLCNNLLGDILAQVLVK